MTIVPQPVKELQDVLDAAAGVVESTIEELEDGFQVTDLVPIVSENVDKALAAFENGHLISVAFKDHLKESIQAISHFVIDVACDVLKVGHSTEVKAFKETQELIAAVSGLVASIVDKLPGGFKATEIVPVVYENFKSIIVGVEGVDKVGSEFKGDIRAFLHLTVGSVIAMAFDLKDAIEKKV